MGRFDTDKTGRESGTEEYQDALKALDRRRSELRSVRHGRIQVGDESEINAREARKLEKPGQGLLESKHN